MKRPSRAEFLLWISASVAASYPSNEGGVYAVNIALEARRIRKAEREPSINVET